MEVAGYGITHVTCIKVEEDSLTINLLAGCVLYKSGTAELLRLLYGSGDGVFYLCKKVPLIRRVQLWE